MLYECKSGQAATKNNVRLSHQYRSCRISYHMIWSTSTFFLSQYHHMTFYKEHMVYLYFHTEKVDLHKIEYSNSLENQLFKALPIKRGGDSLVVRNTGWALFCFICQIDDETVIYTFRFLLVTILSCPPHFEIYKNVFCGIYNFVWMIGQACKEVTICR